MFKSLETVAVEFAAQRNDLLLFDFSQELIPYGLKARESMIRQEFKPSFTPLIENFETTTKCLGCHSFPRFCPWGLC
ncbi:2345_t:CDS:2 [Ambispora gerdemannii]|uniref:2345_t:CDS:1 n=1 Tax=Ambispora gerdemannii TaxID=144530 RepID=A0A9N9D430_9GLOM|nr:2345_t:CDS:2 [Ambispora gerdemannii]